MFNKNIFISFCFDDLYLTKFKDSMKWLKPRKNPNVFLTSDPNTSVEGGNDIIVSISKMIKISDCVIFLITKNYLKSMYCLYELSSSIFSKKKILPIIFDELVVDDVKRIIGNNIKTINAFNSGWEKEFYNEMNKYYDFKVDFDSVDLEKAFNIKEIKNNINRDYIGFDKTYKKTYDYFIKNGVIDFTNTRLNNERYIETLKGAKTLKIVSTTGYHLLEIIKNSIINILIKKGDVYFLLPNKNSDFCHMIAEIENEIDTENNFNRITQEFSSSISILKECIYEALQTSNEIGHIYVGCSYLLLRQTITLVDGYFDNEDKGWAFMSLTIPPKLTRSSTPSLEIETDNKNKTIDDENSLFKLILNHLDSLIKFSKKNNSLIDLNSAPNSLDNGFTLEKYSVFKYWSDLLYDSRKYNKSCDKNHRLLLVVAAQHPLEQGLYPNEEFKARLNYAFEIYNEMKEEYNIYFYIPGSIHCNDEIPLSLAGEKYLLSLGVKKENIYSEEANKKYKSNGVYNTADECFVASKIFFDDSFNRIISICSLYQAYKVFLFFLANGIYIESRVINVSEMYHNPLKEIINILPNIIYEDHNWQKEDSYFANKSREERIPKNKKN